MEKKSMQQSSLLVFCEECGLANDPAASHCAACRYPLTLQVVIAPPVAPVTVAPAPMLEVTPGPQLAAGRARILVENLSPLGQFRRGTILDRRYEILEEIGHGGFSTVDDLARGQSAQLNALDGDFAPVAADLFGAIDGGKTAVANLFQNLVAPIQDRSPAKLAERTQVLNQDPRPARRELGTGRNLQHRSGRDRHRRNRRRADNLQGQWISAGGTMAGRGIVRQPTFLAEDQQGRLLHRFLFHKSLLDFLRTNPCSQKQL